MFSIGVLMWVYGYACLYTGVANLRNNGGGPTLMESMGFKIRIAPAGADQPNLTGQPPATGLTRGITNVVGELS